MMESVETSYLRKGFLIYEEMRNYLTIYEEAVSDFATDPIWISLYRRKTLFYFLISAKRGTRWKNVPTDGLPV